MLHVNIIILTNRSGTFLLELDITEDACSLDSVPEYIKVFLSFPPSGNGKLASWTSILGFVVMMSLDVGLG